MAVVGRALLILGLVVAVYGIGASLFGARTGRRRVGRLGPPGGVRAGRCWPRWRVRDPRGRVPALGLLVQRGRPALLDHHADLLQGWPRRGPRRRARCCLWVFLLSVWSSLILFLTRRRVREIAPYATAVLLGFGAFFTSLAVFFANPFATAARTRRPRAPGLDPLLLHPSMMIHPADAVLGVHAADDPVRVRGRGAGHRAPRRRVDLGHAPVRAGAPGCSSASGSCSARAGPTPSSGWGGYWAWDPVENAALMPWLCITAFIHSIMIQEKRGMLKVWNASLVLASGDAVDPRHLPGPLGDPRLDPRVRRLDARGPVRGADRGRW